MYLVNNQHFYVNLVNTFTIILLFLLMDLLMRIPLLKTLYFQEEYIVYKYSFVTEIKNKVIITSRFQKSKLFHNSTTLGIKHIIIKYYY